MKLLLITGFLGTGKTTFLKRLIAHFEGQKPALIVNEFGKVGMDGKLLSELGASMREITGGSVFCSCRIDQFESALGKVAKENPGIILVEASGLSDPTAVKTLVEQTAGVEYAGCVALCDANRLTKTLATVRVCPKQLAVSDVILLNKIDLVSEEEKQACIATLKERFAQARIEPTTQGAFDYAWIADIKPYAQRVAFEDTGDITLQKACITLAEGVKKDAFLKMLGLFAEDTYRIKGFAQLAEGLYQVDCVSNVLNVIPYTGSMPDEADIDKIVALAGQGMALRKGIKEMQKWYPENVKTVVYG